MKVFKDLNNLPDFKNAVVTTGTFDGVHLGHQTIISKLNRLAEDHDGESIILTFHPHPRFVIKPDDKSLKLIQTLDERIALFEKYGVDNLVVASFSKAFSQISANEYISHFLVDKFHPKVIVIGYDHQFGKDRGGDVTLLKSYRAQYGFEVEEIGKRMLEDISISSSKIREALNSGDVQSAAILLGHPFSISGFVVKGAQIGQSIGFPTANIHVSADYKLIPKTGVYAVQVLHKDRQFTGMLNIGYRPTFEGTGKTIEVNIFDFNESIYGEQINIKLIDRIRDEQKFGSKDLLIQQLMKDRSESIKILNGLHAS